MIPVIISEILSLSWNAVNWVTISAAPCCKNTIKPETKIITRGLNLASHETIIAVNPIPPTISALIV